MMDVLSDPTFLMSRPGEEHECCGLVEALLSVSCTSVGSAWLFFWVSSDGALWF
jgi:hypothetical protein